MQTHQIDRTPEHEQCERQAAAMGIPYVEPIRTLRLTLDGIRYQIFDAIQSWQAPDDDCPGCDRCGYYLQIISPNLLHELPLARCECAAGFLEPLDERDGAFLELKYPVSEQDKNLGERFHRELARLVATVSPEVGRR